MMINSYFRANKLWKVEPTIISKVVDAGEWTRWHAVQVHTDGPVFLVDYNDSRSFVLEINEVLAAVEQTRGTSSELELSLLTKDEDGYAVRKITQITKEMQDESLIFVLEVATGPSFKIEMVGGQPVAEPQQVWP
ncbi:MAG: hypothetical protein LWW87_07110 [Geobacteraceae bacterium]|nr:hypothetical protein [Geobacteraceae bacterium]